MGKFSIKDRLRSFRFAFRGIAVAIKSEHNMWIHLSAGCIAICAGLWFDISRYEWIAIILSIALVLSVEIFNTAIERVADFIQPEQDSRIADIKDLAAAGVIIMAMAALSVGLLVFIPKLLAL